MISSRSNSLESAIEHQYDSNIIRQNSEQAAWQHLVGVTAANNNAAFAQYQGDNASSGRTGAYLGMGGTLLGGIASGMNSYAKWNQTETPSGSGKFWDPALQSWGNTAVRH